MGTTRLDKEYPARFDGNDRIDPYNKDTKEKLYGAVVQSQHHHLELAQGGLQPVSMDRAEGSWVYIDPQKKVHGPYDSATMKAWHEAKYFSDETMICRRNWSAYHRLGDVFPESNKAFVSDDVREPASAPPPQPQAPVMSAAEARAADQAAVGANKKP